MIAICAIIKNCYSDYLIEWINHHRNIGVDKFIIYDNESQIPIKDVLFQYSEHLIVNQIIGANMQIKAYNHCIENYKNDFDWIIFIDDDEFIVCEDIKDFLNKNNEFDCIKLKWKVFGSSGYKTKPENGLLKSFRKRLPDNNPFNNQVKLIVKPDHVSEFVSPHECKFKNNNIKILKDLNNIYINHYFLKSEEEFKRKLKRGRADNIKLAYSQNLFHQIDKNSTIEDLTILNIINEKFKK